MNKVYISRINPTQYPKASFYRIVLEHMEFAFNAFDNIIFDTEFDDAYVMFRTTIDVWRNAITDNCTLIIINSDYNSATIIPMAENCNTDVLDFGDGYMAIKYKIKPISDVFKEPYSGIDFVSIPKHVKDKLNTTINLDSTKSNPKPITFNVAIDVDKLLQDIDKWLEEKSHHVTLSMLEQFAKETLSFKISIKDETNPQSDTAQSVRQEKVE